MTSIYQDKSAAGAMTEKLKIFAQAQRLMILSFLLTGEYSVSDIDDATGIGQPAVSQQLAVLRRADLVNTRREAKQIYYSLANDQVADCVRTIEAMFSIREIQIRPKETLQKSRIKPPMTLSPAGAASFARIIRTV